MGTAHLASYSVHPPLHFSRKCFFSNFPGFVKEKEKHFPPPFTVVHLRSDRPRQSSPSATIWFWYLLLSLLLLVRCFFSDLSSGLWFSFTLFHWLLRSLEEFSVFLDFVFRVRFLYLEVAKDVFTLSVSFVSRSLDSSWFLLEDLSLFPMKFCLWL